MPGPRVVALVLITLFGGCGDDVLPGQPVELEDLGTNAREAVCDWAVRCQHVPDRATCDRLIDPKDYDTRRARDAVAAGRLSYDPQLGGACVDDNRNQACLAGPWTSEFCRDMFAGLVPSGGSCTSGFECPRGSVCEEVVCGAQCCLGVCGPVVPIEDPPQKRIGDSCSSHFECNAQGYCGDSGRCTRLPTEEGQRCLFGCGRGDLFCDLDELVCKRYAGAGESCDPDGVSAPPCDESWAFCEETCQPRPGLGQACDVDGLRDCVPTAYCAGLSCRDRGQPGDPCTTGDQCTVACDQDLGECVEYERCAAR